MSDTIDLLQGELERLFTLEEMTAMSRTLLGLDPHDVGGQTAKGSFARALTERCIDGHRVDALVDAMVVSRTGVDPRVRTLAAAPAVAEELAEGTEIGGFRIERKLGENELGPIYRAQRNERPWTVNVLHRDVSVDPRAVQRFLMANRLVAGVKHAGVPRSIEAGELPGARYYVAHEEIDGEPLSEHLARVGSMRFDEARPLLRGILDALAALHKANVVHGDLRLEHVLVSRARVSNGTPPPRVEAVAVAPESKEVDGTSPAPPERGRDLTEGSVVELVSALHEFPQDTSEDAATLEAVPVSRAASTILLGENEAQSVEDVTMASIVSTVTLVGFGHDRLRPRADADGTRPRFLAVYGSPNTISPEQVRGLAPDARTDIYAFGAILYEILTGKPVFPGTDRALSAFAHLSKTPEVPSSRAPTGWISRELDAFVLSALAKDPADRPRDAAAALEMVERLKRSGIASSRAPITLEEFDALLKRLESEPYDVQTALALEKAAEGGTHPRRIAEALAAAAASIYPITPDDREAQKSLLYRTARVYETLSDHALAENFYARIVELDPQDEIARAALEHSWRQQRKYEELIEMLLARTEVLEAGEDRARALAEIGRLYAGEIGDASQALVAYTQAFCEAPMNDEYVQAVERLAGGPGDVVPGTKQSLWHDVLGTVAQAADRSTLSPTARNVLLMHAARWHEQKFARPDLALLAYQEILAGDPASELAYEGLGNIYRRAQQWPELVGTLLSRADIAGDTPRARDLRTEAAELLEMKLNDPYRAKEIYQGILAADPSHLRAGDAVKRILERTGDFSALVKLLEVRIDTCRGGARVEALVRLGEVYEDRLNDLDTAVAKFEEALAIDTGSIDALKGLDRVFSRREQGRELLDVLMRQIALSATPRQKIHLYERVASLYDEEFLDHTGAAEALEQVLAIDKTNDFALTELPRHLRALDRWEDVVKIYEQHAEYTSDEGRRVELLVSAARTLGDHIGSPERSIRAYERVLELLPSHPASLEAIARLRELSGDAMAALHAIELLAAKALTPEAKCEQWMRAGRLLESRGDRDGAIDRYKMALEINPHDPVVSTALRQAFAKRGDVESVITLIDRELSFAEGELARGRLFAELAKLHRDQTKSLPRAEQAARQANQLDPSNAEAIMVLGDVAYETGQFVDATKHYESLVGRVSALAKEDAIRCLVRFCEGALKTGEAAKAQEQGSRPPPNPRLLSAVAALQKIAPQDVQAQARVARVLLDHGDPVIARTIYTDLTTTHLEALSHGEKAEAFFGLGESLRRLGDVENAVGALREAAALDPAGAEPLKSLARIYEEKKDWMEFLRVKKRRLDVAATAERFELLLEIGDVFFHKLDDRAMATRTYSAALEERPTDRKILTRLMQLYSEEKDWAKLVEVVLRLADFVDDRRQRAKYMHTAAIVSSRQLGDMDAALNYYDRAVEFDPTLTVALEEAIELRGQQGDQEGIARLLKVALEHAKGVHDRDMLRDILDRLGDVYEKGLNDIDLAIDALEAAQAFDPDNRPRAERLAEMYLTDLGQYFDKAVRAQAEILRKNPYRVESYKLLRRLYTDAHRADAAFCLCQALTVLNLAEPDEEDFYRQHRADNAAPAKEPLREEEWVKLAHRDQDDLLTKLFAMIQPTIIRARTQPLEALGYDRRYAIDLTLHPYPVSQTLYYAAGTLGMDMPLVFQNPNDPSGLGFVHAHTPAIVLGRAAFEAPIPAQALAFVAGRHLSYFRPGHYVRHLLPSGTALKSWLFAAIKWIVPQFPVASEIQAHVSEAMTSLRHEFEGVQRDMLAGVVQKLLQGGGALDLKRWVAAVDLTADRAGLVLAHDLQGTIEMVRATEEGASVAVKERLKEAVLFGTSEEYMAIRERLGVTIG
jgi:tetratricopeptide (TPR) repeat protein